MNTGTNIMAASYEWQNRPADERFRNVPALRIATEAKRASTARAVMKLAKMKIVNENGKILIEGKNTNALMTHLGFSQLATILECPAGFLTSGKLEADTVCRILNERIGRFCSDGEGIDKEVSVLIREKPDGLRISAVNSEKYAEIHDLDVIPIAEKFVAAGWKVPPARPPHGWTGETWQATEDDVLKYGNGGLQVRVGDICAPAGIYMGDRNMFVFLVNDRAAVDDGNGHPLLEATILQHSEVGQGTFSVTRILCDGVCGNHIIWDAKKIDQLKYRHIGDAHTRVMASIKDYIIGDPRDLSYEVSVIAWMRDFKLGETQDDVVDFIYKLRIPEFTQTVIREIIKHAENHRTVDGDPFYLYGFANAATRWSQTLAYADERTTMDRATGKLYAWAAKTMK